MKADVGKLMTICNDNQHILDALPTQFDSVYEMLKGKAAKIEYFELRLQEI